MPHTVPATKPTTLPAVAERVYDRWVFAELKVTGTGVGTDVPKGYVRFRKCREIEGGSLELGPAADVATLDLADVYGLAAQYPEVQAALEAVIAAAFVVADVRKVL